MQTVRDTLFIGGQWVEPATKDTIDVISPTDESVVGQVPVGSLKDVDHAVASARASFDGGTWRTACAAERGAVIKRAFEALEPQAEDLAVLTTKEIGACINHSRNGHVTSALAVLNYYAELAGHYEFEERVSAGPRTSVVLQEPVGVVAGIVPWNGPLIISMLKVAPALAAGCSVVLKPALEAPLQAFALADALEKAGLPVGVLSVVPTDNIGAEYLVRHPDVDAVTFTGSSAVGSLIGSICGEHLKRATLELGGKSAAIILDDADLDKTIAPVLRMSFLNNGQACINLSRILVPTRRRDEIVTAIVDWVSAMTMGDPMDPATDIGPLVSAKQRDRVEQYVAFGRHQGARLVVGGRRPDAFECGFFYEPTVFVDVDNSMTIAQEEIFGPVVAVIEYDSVDDAIRIANDSKYGLTGSVWTEDEGLGMDVARQVRAGSYKVNGAENVFGMPMGGFKHSGIGREFGVAGLRGSLETKSIAVHAP